MSYYQIIKQRYRSVPTYIAVLLCIAGGTLIVHTLNPTSVEAASENITATIAFADPLSITSVQNMDFGIVADGQAGNITLDTNNTITSSDITLAGGSPTSAALTITGSATQSIVINANNYTSNNGVDVQAATCRYDTGVQQACTSIVVAAPGGATNISVGATVNIDGTQAAGTTAAPTFDLEVLYQ